MARIIPDSECTPKQLAAIDFVRDHYHIVHGLSDGKIRIGIAGTFIASDQRGDVTFLFVVPTRTTAVLSTLGY